VEHRSVRYTARDEEDDVSYHIVAFGEMTEQEMAGTVRDYLSTGTERESGGKCGDYDYHVRRINTRASNTTRYYTIRVS